MKIEMSGAKLYTYDELLLIRHLECLATLQDARNKLLLILDREIEKEKGEVAYWREQVEADRANEGD